MERVTVLGLSGARVTNGRFGFEVQISAAYGCADRRLSRTHSSASRYSHVCHRLSISLAPLEHAKGWAEAAYFVLRLLGTVLLTR